MTVTRRRFLLAGAGLAAGLGVGAFTAVKTLHNEPYAGLARLIRAQLPYASIDDSELRAFCADYHANLLITRMPAGIGTLRRLNAVHLLPQSVRTRLTLPRRYESLTEDIVSTFIKSTDLLQVCAKGCGSDAPPTSVRYLGFYTPYQRPCYNPFSQGLA